MSNILFYRIIGTKDVLKETYLGKIWVRTIKDVKKSVFHASISVLHISIRQSFVSGDELRNYIGNIMTSITYMVDMKLSLWMRNQRHIEAS